MINLLKTLVAMATPNSQPGLLAGSGHDNDKLYRVALSATEQNTTHQDLIEIIERIERATSYWRTNKRRFTIAGHTGLSWVRGLKHLLPTPRARLTIPQPIARMSKGVGCSRIG